MTLKGIRSGVVFAAIVAAGLLIPEMAFAAAPTTLGNVVTNGSYTILPINNLLSIISYVMGVSLAIWGLVRLKVWGADGQTSFSDGLWRIMGGTFLVGLPDIILKIENSFYGGSWTAGSSDSGGTNLVSGLTANTNGTVTLDQAMVNLMVDIYAPGKAIIAWSAWIVGVVCLMTGLYRLAQSGQAGQGRAPAVKGTVGYMLGGALMLSAGNIMDAINQTLFGATTTALFTSLSYNVPGGADQTAINNVIKAMFAFVEIIGWIAFIRGLYLLVKLAQGGHDKSHAHAFSHIFFGAAAVNMYFVVTMIQKTLGVNIV